jgi:hypothetical protein
VQNWGQTAGRRRRTKLLFWVATAVQLSEALFVWNWIEFCIILSRLNFVVRFYRDDVHRTLRFAGEVGWFVTEVGATDSEPAKVKKALHQFISVLYLHSPLCVRG